MNISSPAFHLVTNKTNNMTFSKYELKIGTEDVTLKSVIGVSPLTADTEKEKK